VGSVREKARFVAGLVDQAGGLYRFLAQARRVVAGKPREP